MSLPSEQRHKRKDNFQKLKIPQKLDIIYNFIFFFYKRAISSNEEKF